MTYVISSKCAGTCDTACVDVCPCDCIVGPIPVDQLRAGPRPPGIQQFIDPDECIDCGACAAECPVDAIARDVDADPADVARNAAFFRLAK